MSIGSGFSLYVMVESHLSVFVSGYLSLVCVSGGVREGGVPLTGADVVFFFSSAVKSFLFCSFAVLGL